MKTLIVSVCFLVTGIVSAQANKELEAEAKKMYTANYEMDFDTLLDYLYPQIFELAPREVMLETLKQTFQNPEMKIRFAEPNPKFSISDIKKIEGKEFGVVRYNSTMIMSFKEPLDAEMANMILSSLQQAMENKKISYTEENNSFKIQGEDIMIAIKDDRTADKWKFINYDPNQSELFDNMFSEKVKIELGL